MMLSMWKKSFRSIMVLGKQEAMLLFLPMYIDYLISGSVPRTLKRILFFFVFSPVSKKVKKYKNYFFFYPCFRRLYRYVLFLNGTVMLERVVLGCIKVSTGKKGFSLFSTILVKIAQGHSTLAFTTYLYYVCVCVCFPGNVYRVPGKCKK